MVTFKLKLRKRIIFLISIFSIIAVGFIALSIYQWTKLANEEYFYDNPKKLYKKLESLPSDLNIENVKRIRASVNPTQFKFVVMGDSRGNHKVLNKIIKSALSHKPDFIIFLGGLIFSFPYLVNGLDKCLLAEGKHSYNPSSISRLILILIGLASLKTLLHFLHLYPLFLPKELRDLLQ